jgi:hypothetical protein
MFVTLGSVYLPFLDETDKTRILTFLSSCMKDETKLQSPFFSFRSLQPVINFATQCIECYNSGSDVMPKALQQSDMDIIPRVEGVRNPTADEMREFAIDIYNMGRPKRQLQQWVEMQERVVHFMLVTNPRLNTSWSDINSDVTKIILDQLWNQLGN